MFRRYALFAATAIFLVIFIYVLRFGFQSEYKIAPDPAAWGPFGDYVGGILNPILSFISVMLLIHSLRLQNEANMDLRQELKNSERTEKMRSFSTLFFNMITSQKELFDSFAISFSEAGELKTKHKASAVLTIEHEIERLREAAFKDEKISEYLDVLDTNDHIFGILRAFYITVRTVSENLDAASGFSPEDRKSQFLTLINFTDFAQLRLVLIAVQFLSYPAAEYLRSNEEFRAVLTDVGMSLDLY